MNTPSRKLSTPPLDPLKHFAHEAAEAKLEALRTHSRYALMTRAVTVLGGGGVGSALLMASGTGCIDVLAGGPPCQGFIVTDPFSGSGGRLLSHAAGSTVS